MRLKTLLVNTLVNRKALPVPVLAVPGAGLILLGVLVYLLPALFIFLISTTLIVLGVALLFLAFRMRPKMKKARITVVESDESW